MMQDLTRSDYSSSDYSRGSSLEHSEAFVPHRRQFVYKLNIPDKDITKYSLGGFMIGNKGAKIQTFLTPINQ